MTFSRPQNEALCRRIYITHSQPRLIRKEGRRPLSRTLDRKVAPVESAVVVVRVSLVEEGGRRILHHIILETKKQTNSYLNYSKENFTNLFTNLTACIGKINNI